MTDTSERSYDVHGVALSARASDPAVLEAMDLRLRGFGNGRADVGAEVVFEFARGQPDGAPRGRPVYETPHGSLRYDADTDSLAGAFGSVELLCHPGAGVARIRCSRFEREELYMATHPLATVSMMELLERRGLFSLHAACLAGADGRGVLLAGTSGAGKSTLALALARTGMGFLSDDVVFLRRADGVTALGFADAVGLTEFSAECFPELRGLLAEPPPAGFPKRLARIEDLFGAPPVSECAPRVLVFPHVARDRPSELTSIDPGEAMLRLVPDVLLTDPAATQAHLAAIAALLDQVECFELRSGKDLERAAELVRGLV